MSWFKKSWSDHMKHVNEDLNREVTRSFQFQYQEKWIRVDNFWDEEKLYLDGTLIAHHKNSRWYHWIQPYRILKATVHLDSIGESLLEVKIGGLIALHCEVKCNGQQIFKETHRISLY